MRSPLLAPFHRQELKAEFKGAKSASFKSNEVRLCLAPCRRRRRRRRDAAHTARPPSPAHCPPPQLIASNYTDTLDVFTINNKVMVYEGTLDSLKKIRGAKAPETSAGYPMEVRGQGAWAADTARGSALGRVKTE